MNFNFELFTLEINKNSQSWINVFMVNTSTALFYIEWDYDKEITNVQLFWLFDWYRKY